MLSCSKSSSSFDLDIGKFMKVFNWLKKLWEKIREVDSIIRQINR